MPSPNAIEAPTAGVPVSDADRDRRRALVDEGRARLDAEDLAGALRAFVAANRIRADAATERRIIKLRRRVALALPERTPAQTWPRQIDDPFPGVTELPEIRPDELDLRTLGGSILHHGGVIVRGLATGQQADALRTAIGNGIDAWSARPNSTSEWYAPLEWDLDPMEMALARQFTQDTGGLLAVDAPRAFFLLADLFEATGVVEVIEQYLSDTPVLSVQKTTVRRIREVIAPAWHQDGSFLGHEVRAVNIWLSLSTCGGDSDAVGLDVVPHRVEDYLETGTDDAGADEVAIGPRAIDAAAAIVVTPEFQPGDALLFDERFVHRTSGRLSRPSERYAVESWFFGASHFPESYGAIIP